MDKNKVKLGRGDVVRFYTSLINRPSSVKMGRILCLRKETKCVDILANYNTGCLIHTRESTSVEKVSDEEAILWLMEN